MADVLPADAWFRRTDDAVTGRPVIEAFGMGPTEQFSTSLLAKAEPWIVVEGDKITLNMANGRWVYVVTEVNEAAGTITARWPD